MKNLEQSRKLYELCKKGFSRISDIKEALSLGADINYSLPGYGYTPLHMAADLGDTSLVEFLLEHDANPNPYSYNIKTPLDMTNNNKKDVISLMLCYGCHKAESKGAYFEKMIKQKNSPFMLDDVCIMKSFCGDGFKIYAAKTDSPNKVNFFGNENDAPELIGCVTAEGEIVLTKEFSDLYFPVGSKKYLHEYTVEFDGLLHERVMEAYKDALPVPTAQKNVDTWYNVNTWCDNYPKKARRIAALGDDVYGRPYFVSSDKAVDLLCGKIHLKDFLDEINSSSVLRKKTVSHVKLVNLCLEKYADEIQPYEYAIADFIKKNRGIKNWVQVHFDDGSMIRGTGIISFVKDFDWKDIRRIEKNGEVLYDYKDYAKEEIER